MFYVFTSDFKADYIEVRQIFIPSGLSRFNSRGYRITHWTPSTAQESGREFLKELGRRMAAISGNALETAPISPVYLYALKDSMLLPSGTISHKSPGTTTVNSSLVAQPITLITAHTKPRTTKPRQ